MKKVFAIALTIMAVNGFAAMTNDTQIRFIDVDSRALNGAPDGILNVFTESAVENPHGCADSSKYASALGTDAKKSLLALFLTAHSAGKSVHLFIDGCIDNAPNVYGARIR